MAYEQKPNTGSLFRNKEKKDDKDRDMSGSAQIAGVDYWISGYTNETADGAKWLKLQFKPKEDRPARSANVNTRRGSVHDIPSDEPW